jgi:hypothetical protein
LQTRPPIDNIAPIIGKTKNDEIIIDSDFYGMTTLYIAESGPTVEFVASQFVVE